MISDPFNFMVIDLMMLIIILSIGIFITLICSKCFELSFSRSFYLFIWHTFFSFVYVWYTRKYYGDSIFYYEEATNGISEFSVSNESIIYITSFIYYFSKISFLNIGVLFGFFGLIGLLAFDGTLRSITKSSSKNIKTLATLVILLPSISYWSSGLGKDSIAFMSVSLILWSSLKLNKRKLVMLLGISSMLMIRPHVAALLLVALTFGLFFEKKIKIFIRLFYLTIIFIIIIKIIPFSLNFIGMGKDISLQSIINFIELRQSYNWKNFEGGIDISSMNLVNQIFSYLFRPLPMDAHSLTALISSFENIFLFILFLFGVISKIKGASADQNINLSFCWFYSLAALIIFSVTTANYGISMRQKWMFLPFLIVIFISYISCFMGSYYNQKISKN